MEETNENGTTIKLSERKAICSCFRVGARVVPHNEHGVTQYLVREKTEGQEEAKPESKSYADYTQIIVTLLLHLIIPPFGSVLLLSMVMFPLYTTRDTGNLLWSSIVNGQESVQTECETWINMTTCRVGEDYTELANMAGGARALSTIQVMYLSGLLLMYYSALRMVFLDRCNPKLFWWVYGFFIYVWIIFFIHWYWKEPMLLYIPYYGMACAIFAILCFAFMNQNCESHKKVMREPKEVLNGIGCALVVAVGSMSALIIIGAFTSRKININPFIVILVSNLLISLCSRIILSFLKHCKNFPTSLCTWLTIVYEITCFTAQRDYIASLGNLGDVFVVSLAQTFFEISKCIIVLVLRKRKVCKKRTEGRLEDAKRYEIIISIDFLTDIVAEFLGLVVSTLRSISCDPRLFVVSLPFVQYSLHQEISSFAIQMALELFSDVCIIAITLRIFRDQPLPFDKLKTVEDWSSLLTVVTITVCTLFIEVQWLTRRGCISCVLRNEGYSCPSNCDVKS